MLALHVNYHTPRRPNHWTHEEHVPNLANTADKTRTRCRFQSEACERGQLQKWRVVIQQQGNPFPRWVVKLRSASVLGPQKLSRKVTYPGSDHARDEVAWTGHRPLSLPTPMSFRTSGELPSMNLDYFGKAAVAGPIGLRPLAKALRLASCLGARWESTRDVMWRGILQEELEPTELKKPEMTMGSVG